MRSWPRHEELYGQMSLPDYGVILSGETGQAFVSGLKVLVKVTVDFHELYGYSLTVVNIDPTYTLGDMVRRRKEILRQLDEEGILTLNKELKFSRTDAAYCGHFIGYGCRVWRFLQSVAA